MLTSLRQGSNAMRRESKSLRYSSYLLRLWQEQGEQATTWRFSLDDPRTGERIGFAGLAHVIDFLRMQMEAQLESAPQHANERASQADTSSEPPADAHSGNE